MKLIFNHRILDLPDKKLPISKARILYHFENKTEWDVVYTAFDYYNVCSKEELYGNSIVILAVPMDCMNPKWATDDFE